MRRRTRIIENFRDACRYRSVPRQFVDLVIHKLKINTYWEDYYRFGFYRGDKSWSERALYVSMQGSRYWPWEGNSLKFDHLFIHKSLQKAVLMTHDHPTPPIVMKVGTDYAINTLERFAGALEKIDFPIVTKFDGGGGGVGNIALNPEAGKFRFKDNLVDAEWIWRQYEDNLKPGFLVEKMVANHADIDDIHPASLNTLRLITVKGADGNWRLLRPYLKIGRGGSHVDNSSAGGIFAGIDENGRLGVAYSSSGKSFDAHPDTGSRIKGRNVPDYDKAVALALEASQTFGFMSTIGWDIGLTTDGPVIIEGNQYWDPYLVQERIGPFLNPEIVVGLIPRHWWTPWDKTHMYPNYMKKVDGGWWQRLLARRRRRWNSLLKDQLAQTSN